MGKYSSRDFSPGKSFSHLFYLQNENKKISKFRMDSKFSVNRPKNNEKFKIFTSNFHRRIKTRTSFLNLFDKVNFTLFRWKTITWPFSRINGTRNFTTKEKSEITDKRNLNSDEKYRKSMAFEGKSVFMEKTVEWNVTKSEESIFLKETCLRFERMIRDRVLGDVNKKVNFARRCWRPIVFFLFFFQADNSETSYEQSP